MRIINLLDIKKNQKSQCSAISLIKWDSSRGCWEKILQGRILWRRRNSLILVRLGMWIEILSCKRRSSISYKSISSKSYLVYFK